MSFFRGQRFRIDLDSDGSANESDEGDNNKTNRRNKKPHTRNNSSVSRPPKSPSTSPSLPISSSNKRSNTQETSSEARTLDAMSTYLISDVFERKPPSTFSSSSQTETSLPAPPSLSGGPASRSMATGFPAHRKRVRGSGSVFKNGVGQMRQERAGDDNKGKVMVVRPGQANGRNGGGSSKEGEGTVPGAEKMLSSISDQLRMDVQGGDNGGSHVQKDNDSIQDGRGLREMTIDHGRSTAGLRQRSNSIDRENKAKLAAMTPSEIEQEREELMAQLSSEFVERLMKRVDIDSRHGDATSGGDVDDDAEEFPDLRRSMGTKDFPNERKAVEGQDEDVPNVESAIATTSHLVPSITDTTKKSVTFATPPSPLQSPSAHKPDRPPSPRTLHRLYFPNQPPPDATPALSWTLPLSSSNDTRKQTSLSISALRFSLSGNLIPPSVALSLPVTLGLHHHAANPDIAGYTVAELTRLSRSAVPAQRCVAIKALGGIGKWLDEQMRIEKVGREETPDRKANESDKVDGNDKTSGNKIRRTGDDGIKDEDKKSHSEDDSGSEVEVDEEDNPRIALLKGLWALAKHERVLDILRLQACVRDENGDERSSGAEDQEVDQDPERIEQSHRHRHHQSVIIYAEDALRTWLDVERRMRVRRAI